jgi:hypothetical protein
VHNPAQEEHVTNTGPQQVLRGVLARGWDAFRRWRRTRPFWGGLFTLLAGVEIFATTQPGFALGGLTFQFGPTGFLSWLIPVVLAACGLLFWFTPQQRMFYAIVASVTAVYSLIGVNLGGFFIGLLLGMVGSALGFAWTPVTQPAESEDTTDAADDDEETGGLTLVTGAEDDSTAADRDHSTDPLPQPRNPLGQQDPSRPPLAVILLLLLGLATTGLVAVRATPAQAGPCPPAAERSAPAATSEPAAGDPAVEDGAQDGEGDGNLLTDIVDGVIGILTGDDEEAEPTPTPTASPSATAEPGDEPTPQPTECAPAPGKGEEDQGDAGDKNNGKDKGKGDKDEEALPGDVELLDTPPGQPLVAKTPSLLTGSKVTMLNLRMDGLVDLPTVDGTIRVLQFSMSRAVTTDFRLEVPGQDDETTTFASDTLTVSGDVTFYAKRFTGRIRLLDMDTPLVVTLTPENPLFPDGFPLPIPGEVSFSDPEIELVFVDCDRLTARPLDLTLP